MQRNLRGIPRPHAREVALPRQVERGREPFGAGIVLPPPGEERRRLIAAPRARRICRDRDLQWIVGIANGRAVY